LYVFKQKKTYYRLKEYLLDEQKTKIKHIQIAISDILIAEYT